MVFEDALDVAFSDVRERREVAVRERQPIVIVAQIQRLAETWWEAFDKEELATVRALANRWRFQLDAERLAIRPLDLVDHGLPILPRLDLERVVRAQEFPVEKIPELTPVDRHQVGPRRQPDFLGDTPGDDARDADHYSKGAYLNDAIPGPVAVVSNCCMPPARS